MTSPDQVTSFNGDDVDHLHDEEIIHTQDDEEAGVYSYTDDYTERQCSDSNYDGSRQELLVVDSTR